MKRSVPKPAVLSLSLAALLLFPVKSMAFIEAIALAVVAAAQLLVVASTTAYNSSEFTAEQNQLQLDYDAKQLRFVEQNLDEILIDMAAGGGEYLSSLALLEGCPASSHPKLAKSLQQNYHRLDSSPTPGAVLRFVELQIRTDSQLHVDCKGTPIGGVTGSTKKIAPTQYQSPDTVRSLAGSYASMRTSTRNAGGTITRPILTLQQHGKAISGTFTDPDGQLSGDIEGDIISFYWTMKDGGSGEGRWTVSADGATLTGTWSTVSGSDRGSWNLTRIDEIDATGTVEPRSAPVPDSSRIDETGPVESAEPRSVPLPDSSLVDESDTAQTPAPRTAPVPDIAGAYQVRVSRRPPLYWCFNERKRFRIQLTQQGDKFQGDFGSGIDGGISGFIDGDRIHFNWFTSRCPGGTDGEWTIEANGSGLHGSSALDFEWTLTRDE